MQKKGTNFSIRVSDEQRTFLEKLARDNQLKLTELIRLAIESLCLQTRMNGGELFIAQNSPQAKKFLAQTTLEELRHTYGSLDNVPADIMPNPATQQARGEEIKPAEDPRDRGAKKTIGRLPTAFGVSR
ncbi:MAG: hypothetical protein LBK76_09880 [Verrucomicrobiales bacterium]|nr:hypothetical protein [Verrucomicrobiales bacterium]